MLVYLHGFNSSAQSTKARLMGDYLARSGMSHRYACPSLPHRPAEAIAMAETAMAGRPGSEVCFLGSSLGGFYATHLAEKHNARAVLINPAIDPHIGLRAYLGPQSNLYTGEKYQLTETHLQEWEALRVARVTPENFLLLVETGDEVLDYRQALNFYAGARQVVIEGGDHSLQSFPRHIAAMLEFAGIHGT
ncbi:MAG: esterase [Betaproteobacteria bacterium RIFCSPLOWO2_02_FULL_62_17]|nr:MAG: esterase [Betaproteobacteria bacterium RIFCSPLOWO2_02_FULL_62_17]